MQQALATAAWPGRCQTVQGSPTMTLRLDGAHTIESILAGLEWFRNAVTDKKKVLV